MFRVIAVSCVLMISIVATSAQPSALPQENVTVTAIKSREILEKFAKAFIAPTRLTGKIARWQKGICPLTLGQPPSLNRLVTQRVKEVAARVGVPVNTMQSCTANIEIIFTTTPQALLGNIRVHNPLYLGYADTAAQRAAAATVTRPVQAWYTTETVDLDGIGRIDGSQQGAGVGIRMACYSCLPACGGCANNNPPIDLPYASFASVTGRRINDGTTSALNHVIITVDTSKLVGHDFGPLTDYIAMLALTQLNSLDTCQQLPSIVNLLAPNCDQKVSTITEMDLAHLRGLYKMSAEKSLLFEQNDIVDRMKDALSGTTPIDLQVEFAQDHEAVISAAASAGNLSVDFYIKSTCEKPDRMSFSKPVYNDETDVARYNYAVELYNKQLKAFDTCINEYTSRASHDIDWILFTVNTAVAKAKGSNPPSAPTVFGNMPSGFYPSPACALPDKEFGTPPDVNDVKAMDAYNAKVRDFNALAESFSACLKTYETRARLDIERVENAQRDAASQTSVQ